MASGLDSLCPSSLWLANSRDPAPPHSFRALKDNGFPEQLALDGLPTSWSRVLYRPFPTYYTPPPPPVLRIAYELPPSQPALPWHIRDTSGLQLGTIGVLRIQLTTKQRTAGRTLDGPGICSPRSQLVTDFAHPPVRGHWAYNRGLSVLFGAD